MCSPVTSRYCSMRPSGFSAISQNYQLIRAAAPARAISARRGRWSTSPSATFWTLPVSKFPINSDIRYNSTLDSSIKDKSFQHEWNISIGNSVAVLIITTTATTTTERNQNKNILLLFCLPMNCVNCAESQLSAHLTWEFQKFPAAWKTW